MVKAARRLGTIAVAACAGMAHAQPADEANWIPADFGEWEEFTKWTTNPFYPQNGHPEPGDTYNVFIQAIGDGTPYIVQLDNSVPVLTVDAITLDAPNATLRMVGSEIDMQGGTISILRGRFRPESSAVRNATIDVNGGTVGFGAANSVILDGVTLVGDPVLAGGNAEVINGLGLDGTWALSNEFGATLRFVGDQVVSGGTFSYSPVDVQEWYVFIADGSTITLSPDTTIEGGATKGLQLGRSPENPQDSDNTLINQGTIHANAEQDRVEIWSNTFVNEGLIEVSEFGIFSLSWSGTDYISGTDLGNSWTNEGTIRLSLGTINLAGEFLTSDLGTFERVLGFINLYGTMDNAGETFDASLATTRVYIDHGAIIGGTVVVSDEGIAVGPEATFRDVTFVGDLHSDQNGSTIAFVDDVALDDELIIDHDNVLVDMQMASFDDGTVRWNVGASGSFLAGGVDGHFTLGPNATITGSGFNISSEALVTNHGLIESIGCEETFVGADFLNEGVVRADVCGDLRFPDVTDMLNFQGDTLTGGTWEVVNEGVIRFFGRSIVVNDATIIRDGPSTQIPELADLASNLGSLTLTGGADQTTAGDLENAGTLHVGDGSIMSVNGALTLTPTSHVQTVVSTSQSGMIAAAGAAHVDGTLDVTLADGYQPMIGDTLTVLTASAIDGVLETVTLPDPPPGLRFVYTQQARAAGINVVCAGDFNGDGVLNILDFVDFQNAFVAGDAGADCDGNGVLNILDFVCFQNAFSQGC